MKKHLEHVIYSDQLRQYLHAYNNEVTILTWCKEKHLSIHMTRAQIDQFIEKLRNEFPKFRVLDLRII